MGLSSKEARKLYGFVDFHPQEEKILDAIEEAHEIRRSVTELAQAENTATLRALGILVPDDSDTEDSDSAISDDDCVDWMSENASSGDEITGVQQGKAISETCESSSQKGNRPPLASIDRDSMNKPSHDEVTGVQQGKANSETCESSSQKANRPPLDSIDCDSMNKSKESCQSIAYAPSCDHMLFILRENNLNWFSFVEELKTVTRGFTQESFNQLLIDFAFYIPSSDVTMEVDKFIEESRQAFLATERRFPV